MRKRIHKILVTGGAGFIGSEFVRQAITRDCLRRGLSLIVVDKLTYAGDLKRLEEVKGKYKFYKADICDKNKIEQIFKKEQPEIIVNFAAETHVDRSIRDANPFIESNIKGVQVLLDISRKCGVNKFVHLSSDEVYGEIRQGRFNEDSPVKPNSPYAASKAAADLLIKSYRRTYGLPAIIIRPCNNYGPWQYPEKFIPVVINHALQNKKIPVYAQGLNVREWLFVSDCAEATLFLVNNAKPGETYNIGSGHHERNIDIAKMILKILKKPVGLIKFVKDRPGHDFRYALDSSKIIKLGWSTRTNFSSSLEITVAWNIANRKWLMGRAT